MKIETKILMIAGTLLKGRMSEDAKDYNFNKTTPAKVKNKILREAERTNKMLNQMSQACMEIYDELTKM